MATLIRIKRSGTYTSGSPAIAQGELAYTYSQANNPANGQGHKLFIGTGTETNGVAATTEVIGGSYFTDMMDHVAGVTTASSALVVDANKRLDDFYVDDIRINGNVISSTDIDADIILRPDGTGSVVLEDDNALEFGNSTDVSIAWNNAGNKLTVTGGDVEFGSTVALTLLDNTVSSSTTSGALIVTGGVGIGGALNVGGTFTLTDDLAVNGGDLTTTQTTFNLLNATATTVNAFGAATTIEIGAATGTTNINNNLVVDLDLQVKGGNITTDQTSFNLLNTTATTVNAFGAASTLNLGATSGTATIANPTVAGTQTTQYLWNTVATTINAFGAATTLNLGATTGTTTIKSGEVVLDGDLQVKGGDITTNQTSFNLLDTTATTVNAFGAATTVNLGTSSTLFDLGSLRIQGTSITSESGSQTITLDPYPAGGDAGGEVIIRGNLTVTGLSTTVNSTQVSVNDPIFTLGDSISEKTLTSSAASGATTLTFDNTTGLNVGDIISGSANIPNGTKISTIDSSTQITIDTALTGGISSGTALTFTLAMNDALDRGIEFKYYSSSLKLGFFGYDESTSFFTFIPDATNTSNVFSGTKGDAHFNTVKYEIGINKGVAYFDSAQKLTTTVAAGTSDISNSYKILTSNGATGEPVWTDTLDGGTF